MSSEKDTTRPKSVSTVELNRRWQDTRKAMKEARLDFLLIENAASLFPGHIRWFTDMTVADGDPTTLIFPREDDITTITFGDNTTNEPMMPLPVLAGVKKRFSVPMLPNLKDTGYLNAEIVVEALKSYRNCRIGLVGLGFMSVAFYQYVTSHLESAKFVDATDLVDTIKVIKSQEEISLIRDTCRIQDEVFDYLVNHVQSGRKISEIRADASRRCSELGANKTNIMLMVMGKMPSLSPIVIEPGDQIVCLIESDGPSGFWGELCRTICLGKSLT